MANWRIEGQYMETCNCAFVCPCIGSRRTASSSTGCRSSGCCTSRFAGAALLALGAATLFR